MMWGTTRTLAGSLLMLLVWSGAARAQDEEEPKRPWRNVADLSLVATGGNSEVLSWALSDKFIYDWTNSQLTLEASALKTRTSTRELSNVGGDVVVNDRVETSAEQYWLGGRFRQRLHKSFFAYTTARWFRNELSGIRNRTAASLGLGYAFIQQDNMVLTAEFGGDWTNEEPVAQSSKDFFGVQAVFDYQYKFTSTATFDWDLAVLENLDDTEDLRVNTELAITSAISSLFALKVSYSLLFDNQPVELVVPGVIPDEDAVFAFDKADHRLAASFVMKM